MSNAAAMAEKRAARRAAGLCIYCGAPALEGHSQSKPHLEASRKRQRIDLVHLPTHTEVPWRQYSG